MKLPEAFERFAVEIEVKNLLQKMLIATIEGKKNKLGLQNMFVFNYGNRELSFLTNLEADDEFGVLTALRELLSRDITITLIDTPLEIDGGPVSNKKGTVVISCNAKLYDIATALGLT